MPVISAVFIKALSDVCCCPGLCAASLPAAGRLDRVAAHPHNVPFSRDRRQARAPDRGCGCAAASATLLRATCERGNWLRYERVVATTAAESQVTLPSSAAAAP
jgi:hypothetical protein